MKNLSIASSFEDSAEIERAFELSFEILSKISDSD
jgi:hypothetical protein